MVDRAFAPVFIVGSPRSGTTLLYHLLLSSGGFAVYHAEAQVFNLLAPRFGRLSVARNRTALLDAWLPSEFFRRSGLDPAVFRRCVEAECRSSADLLRLFMEAMTERQGAHRWAECTPENALFIPQIARSLPSALFLHIVRDGRDVACSIAEQGWVGRSEEPGEREVMAGLYWEWLVRRARAHLSSMPGRGLEIRFERLVAEPRETLAAIGEFVRHDLNYTRIQANAIGAVQRPNTSFPEEGAGPFAPVGRWRQRLSPSTLARLEAAVGDTLCELGYSLSSDPAARRAARPAARWQRRLARCRFAGRHVLKTRTPLGRLFTNAALLHDFRAFDRDRLRPAGGNQGA